MTWLVTLLLVIVFATCILCLYSEGMWGNALRLINVVTAALLATSLFEPLADWIEGLGDWFKTCEYLWDFIALWGLFGALMIVFRLITDQLSRVKVRFLKLADQIGGPCFAALVGWTMVCFTLASLHTAPLARNFMKGGFKTSTEERMFLGTAPDRRWLGFVQNLSLNAYSWPSTEAGQNEEFVFDKDGKFLPKYASRRANLQVQIESTGELRKRLD